MKRDRFGLLGWCNIVRWRMEAGMYSSEVFAIWKREQRIVAQDNHNCKAAYRLANGLPLMSTEPLLDCCQTTSNYNDPDPELRARLC